MEKEQATPPTKQDLDTLYGLQPVWPRYVRSTGQDRYQQVNGEGVEPPFDQRYEDRWPSNRPVQNKHFKADATHWKNNRAGVVAYFGKVHPKLGQPGLGGAVPEKTLAEFIKYSLGPPVFFQVDHPDYEQLAFNERGRPIMVDGKQYVVKIPPPTEQQARFPEGPIHSADPIDDYDAPASAVFSEGHVAVMIGKYQDKQVQTAESLGLIQLIPVVWHPRTSPVTQKRAMDLRDLLR